MIGDLHCHSKLSDGSTGLDDIVFYAKRAGLDALAITDHDTMSGVPRAEILGRRYGLTVIPGGGDLHLRPGHRPEGAHPVLPAAQVRRAGRAA